MRHNESLTEVVERKERDFYNVNDSQRRKQYETISDYLSLVAQISIEQVITRKRVKNER